MTHFPSGVRPVKPDHRDRSYPRTFGSITTYHAELNLDFGDRFPDQEAEGLPFGCTGFTQAEICGDEDQAVYQPRYTYDWTRMLEGTQDQDVGCDMRDSLSSTIVYGVLGENEKTQAEALTHRRGAYYNVVDSPDLDAFDDVRSCISTNRRSVSCATPWFAEWQDIPKTGIVPTPATPVSFHNWKISGWKQINGKPYLIGKAWQGPHFGDKGYHYVSRETFNAVMAMSGSACFTVRKAAPDDFVRIKLALLQAILSYIRVSLAKLRPKP